MAAWSSSDDERMFSSALRTRSSAATASTWVVSRWMPMPPVSCALRPTPAGELLKAVLL